MNNKRYEKLLSNYDAHAKRIRKATEVNIFETPEDKRARMARLEANYGDWFEYYFPIYAKSKCASFHIETAKLIISNPIIRLIVNWFRGAAKSVHICMGIPMYLMVKKELHFMLLVGENFNKAKLLLSSIQIQLKYNQKFINDYGDQFNYGDWADGSFTTKDGIHFMALGLGQSPRGARYEAERPDYIVCDDVDTKERCRNPARVGEAVDWIMEDLWGCFDSVSVNPRERFVLANNRINKISIVQCLLDEFNTIIEKCKQENVPVNHHYSRVVAHDEYYNPSWPEKTDADYWRTKRAGSVSRSYNREYLDRPSTEGKLFKTDDIQYKAMLPLDQYDSICFYADLSYKDAGDFKAMKLWGKFGREFHLINCFVRQKSRRQCAEWLYDLYEDWSLKDYNITYKFEGLFAQDEFENDFDEEGDRRGYHIDIVPDKRTKEGKFDRIESMTGKYEKRNVYYNIVLKGSPDFEEAEHQLLGFEKGSGVNDDSPDADHGAWQELNKDSFVSKFVPRIMKRRNKSKF